MTIAERFEGSIISGAIGDAWASGFENKITKTRNDTFYLFKPPQPVTRRWQITDDTQLTVATINAIINDSDTKPESIIFEFLKLYKQRKLIGLGASTLKALEELSFGGHWSQVGRKGEFAAGNGAAMRIAPLAFKTQITHSQIRNICLITHNNDEAYVGSLSVVLAIRAILNRHWTGDENLISFIISKIPDTRLRDRLISIENIKDLKEIGKLGNSGYVVDSVPLALAAANQVKKIGLESMFLQLIDIGGDTDTNCSIAGNIAGALLGVNDIPKHLLDKLKQLQEYNWIKSSIQELIQKENWK